MYTRLPKGIAEIYYMGAKDAHGNLTTEDAPDRFDALTAAIGAQGESKTVYDNAKIVLDAPGNIDAQLMEAKAAVKALSELSGTTAAQSAKLSASQKKARAVVADIKGWLVDAKAWESAVKGSSTETIAMIAASRAVDAAVEVETALAEPLASTAATDLLMEDPVLRPDKTVSVPATPARAI